MDLPEMAKSALATSVQQILQLPLSLLQRVAQQKNHFVWILLALFRLVSPDANLLVLVGQVETVPALVVVCPDGAGGLPPEVLHAPLRGQVGVVAGVLGGLAMKISMNINI